MQRTVHNTIAERPCTLPEFLFYFFGRDGPVANYRSLFSRCFACLLLTEYLLLNVIYLFIFQLFFRWERPFPTPQKKKNKKNKKIIIIKKKKKKKEKKEEQFCMYMFILTVFFHTRSKEDLF